MLGDLRQLATASTAVLAAATRRQAMQRGDLGGIARSPSIQEISPVLGKRRHLNIQHMLGIWKGQSSNNPENSANVPPGICGCCALTGSAAHSFDASLSVVCFTSYFLPFTY